jgi:hypothetical protein
MNSCKFEELRTQLGRLAGEGALVAIKSGTEAEDMSFGDIRILRAMSRDILPLYVKIGGPEARNDIRELADIGVDGMIAPMIESPYALKKFIMTLHDILGPIHFERLCKTVNIETETAVGCLEAILSVPEARELNQVTAARSDLSGSMEMSADDPRVTEACRLIVERSHGYGLSTSVGGSINTENIRVILERIAPDRVNSRNMVLDSSRLGKRATDTVNRCLRFETELYAYLSSMPGNRQQTYENRMIVLRNRMKKSVAISAV